MIEWVRSEPGAYEDVSGRFTIMKTYDRVYGNHWQLHDRNEPNYYKGLYDETSLRDCKLKAEAILNWEKKNDT